MDQLFSFGPFAHSYETSALTRLRIFMASLIPELAMHGSEELPCAIQKCLRAPRNRKASLPSASPTTAANRKGFG